LYGEVIVFTGALEVPRREAADLAAALGCHVSTNVNKETTLLVVGDQDLKRLAGHNKSSKHRKAEELIRMGYPIRIIKESDFLQLIKA
jgi:DNA polymerase-3 subunit epsilon